MQSERLHPASVLFVFARSVKYFALPGLLLLFTGRSSSGLGAGAGSNWEVWMMLLLIPAGIAAVARYLSFRVDYEGTELVIRSGIVFRNERHVPYARIQNLDAIQNVAHRLLGVTEVRVETGGGSEPEATISVISIAAFDEMRKRVFDSRASALAPAAPAPLAGARISPRVEGRTLLRLPVRELLVCGFLENKGLVLIGAAYGAVWELGLFRGLSRRVFDVDSYGPGLVGDAVGAIARGERLPPSQLLVAIAGILLLLLVVRVVSMAWALVRLYGFRLSRVGDDLRTEFGLFTRVAATIPQRRVQTLTIRGGPLHRLMSRASVRVETAGGNKTEAGRGSNEREWLAPIVHVDALPGLVREVWPELDVTSISWQRVHPRAFRRAVKLRLVAAALATLPFVAAFGGPGVGFLPVTIAWAILSARMHVASLGWVSTDEVVAFRSGWLWRRVTWVRVSKIQAVSSIESPLDRRAAMARVRVDTAGASDRSHRVDIPYLSRATAQDLHRRLAALAASTAFRW